MSYWSPEEKSVTEVPIIRTTDREGRTVLVAGLISPLAFTHTEQIPHYKVPKIHLNEDKSPKQARIVLTN